MERFATEEPCGNGRFSGICQATTPNGPYKNGPGEINVPVCIGGKVVYPGDIVVGDEDGVLFIRLRMPAKLLMQPLRLKRKEADIMEHIIKRWDLYKTLGK